MTEDIKKVPDTEQNEKAPDTEQNKKTSDNADLASENETEEELPAAEETAAENEAQEETAEGHSKKEKKAEKKLRTELEEIRKKCADAEAKAADIQNKYLLLAAEYDNFRKRSQKEKEGVYGEAVEDTVKGLLPVIDNLQYASKYGNADPDKFAEGVRLILDKLPENLAKLNIKSFGAPGDTFDPNLHNAVMHEENEAYGEGEIIDVLQCGYLYGDKVIRYAMVKVAN